MKNNCCPCCGHPLPNDAIPGVELRGLQRKIFDAVSRASPGRISTSDLISVIYADRSDGGPMGPESVVRRLVHDINKKLSKLNICIRGQCGSRSEGYRLNAKS